MPPISNSIEHINNLVKAKTPIIWVLTHEERRFCKELYSFIEKAEAGPTVEIWTWSSYQGLLPLAQAEEGKKAGISGTNKDTFRPNVMLEEICNHSPKKNTKYLYILRDFHTVLAQPLPRQIRDIYRQLIRDRKTIIILSPRLCHGPSGQRDGIEPTLEKEIAVVEYELPDYEVVYHEVQNWTKRLIKVTPPDMQKQLGEISDEQIQAYSRALQGLTLLEIEGALAASVAKFKSIDIDYLLAQKKQIVRRSDILEYIETSENFESVGGCDEIKEFFALYSDQFSAQAVEYGVDPLKGLVMTGVPGCGKSLMAKAVAAVWKMPLLRLDIGKVMGSLVGQSEARMREAIAMAEAIAPCILYCDEIDKALSGTKSSNSTDGGTLSRVFGTLLTAMEERMKNVVVIATSNDIQALPPELIRRFDEVFFVDLPELEEREDIFSIHLRKRKRDPKKLKINSTKLAEQTKDFTGSEIEKIVKNALVRAWHDGKREIKMKDFQEAIADTKPISEVMKEQIDKIRDWADGRARYASSKAQRSDKAKKKRAKIDDGSNRLAEVVSETSGTPSLDDLME